MESLRVVLERHLNKVSVTTDGLCSQIISSNNEEDRKAFLRVLNSMVVQRACLEMALKMEYEINANIELNRAEDKVVNS